VAQNMLAPCGIDCSACDIRRAKSEPELLKNILDWFKNERKLDLKPEQITCDGCLGDRSKHWSADCSILKCSVDDHGLDSCSDCAEFPCERLEKWAERDARYAEAFGRLQEMRKGKQRQKTS